MFLQDYLDQQYREEVQWGGDGRRPQRTRRYSNESSSTDSDYAPITAPDGTILHRKSGSQQQHRMVGMDGAIMGSQTTTPHTASRSINPSPKAKDLSKQQCSVYDDNTWEDTSSDNSTDEFEVVLVPDNRRKRLVQALFCVCCILLIVAIALACNFGTRHNEPTQAATFASDVETPYPICQSNNIGPRNLHTPKLQILIVGISDAPGEEQKQTLEAAIADGFNKEAGGCLDGTY